MPTLSARDASILGCLAQHSQLLTNPKLRKDRDICLAGATDKRTAKRIAGAMKKILTDKDFILAKYYLDAVEGSEKAAQARLRMWLARIL